MEVKKYEEELAEDIMNSHLLARYYGAKVAEEKIKVENEPVESNEFEKDVSQAADNPNDDLPF